MRIINKEEDTILFNLQAVSPARQWILLLFCHGILYMPVILYSCFVIAISIHLGFLEYPIALILFQLLMCFIGVYTYYMQINFSWKMRLLFRVGLPVSNLFAGKKKFFLYLLYYTFHSRKVVFFLLKCIGLFLLNIILLQNKDDFIMREFQLIFMIVILIHSLLVYYYVEFMEQMVAFARNLPVSRIKRFLLFLYTYSLILLPELCFMIINRSDMLKLQTIVVFYCIAISGLLLFTSALYTVRLKMKAYLQRVFSIYLVLSIITLSGYYIVICLVNIFIALVIFYRKYYTYEEEA